MKSYQNIDEYIASCPAEVQEILQKIRQIVQKEVPEATEKISYGIPTFFYLENLMDFAAYKKHIGFYPTSSGIEAFKGEIGKYEWSKGTVQFPLDKPMPYELIRKMVRFRVKEVKSKRPFQ